MGGIGLDANDVGNKQLLAGVFVDQVTGNFELAAGKGVNPALVFIEALRMIEMQRMQQAVQQSPIVVPQGPLPKLR